MNYDKFLYCGLDIFNTKGTEIGTQFIVGVDNDKNIFNIFCEENPGTYKFYDLPFNYLSFVDREIDGSVVRLIKHRKPTIEKKLRAYNEALVVLKEV